jgi:pyruvate formate lyase activating enzyme
MMVPRFFDREGPQDILCSLCPHRCRISPGKTGLCGVRRNGGAEAELPYYGYITALAEDPIEKKPLYHWRPGSSILSAGFAGCNLRCPFCQNWRISQSTAVPGRRLSPDEFITLAAEGHGGAVAYTYSEPLVHAEFLLDCMERARKAGIANVLVTNGCVNAEGAAEILSLTDAANIDLKCFSGETYRELLGGDLQTVLNFIRTAVSLGVHTELTTLVVPGLNDGDEELDGAAAFIAALRTAAGFSVPWHLSAYHPDWRWDALPTKAGRLLEIARKARRRLPYVYIGNAAAPPEYRDTFCRCGAALVRRGGRRVDTGGLAAGRGSGRRYRCGRCGEEAPVLY